MGACAVPPADGTRARNRLPPESGCAPRCAAQFIDKGFVSKLWMAFREQLGKGEDWDPVKKKGNTCSGVLVQSCLRIFAEVLKKVSVPGTS